MKKRLYLLLLCLLAIVTQGTEINAIAPKFALGSGNEQTNWEETSSLAIGDVVLFTNKDAKNEMKAIESIGSNSVGTVEAYTEDIPTGLYPLTVVAGSAEGSVAFRNADGKYLAWTSGNTLTTSNQIADASSWTVTFTDGVPTIANVGTPTRLLQYNSNSPRFACYGNSNQTPVDLWKQVNTSAAVAEPYAALSDNNTILTFYYDDQKMSRSGMDAGPFSSASERGWNSMASTIKTVVFDDSFASYTELTSTAYWFSGCSGLKTLDVSILNTANVTDMQHMFYNCSGLTTIYADEDNWTTTSVTNGDNMFSGCTSLVGGNGTVYNANHINAEYARIDKSGQPGYFSLKGGGNEQTEWEEASSLAIGDIVLFTNIDAKKEMKAIETVGSNSVGTVEAYTDDIPSGLYPLTVVAGSAEGSVAFKNASGKYLAWTSGNTLTTSNEIADASSWTVTFTDGVPTIANVDTPDRRLQYNSGSPRFACYTSSQKPIDLWKQVSTTPIVAEPYAVLSDGGQIVTFYYDDQKAIRGGIDINNSFIPWDSSSPYGTATTAVFDASFTDYRPVSTAYWFQKCSSLTTITGIENLNTSNVTKMSYMFYYCSGLTSLDVSGFNTSNVMYMNSMFHGCSGLTSLDVSGFDTSNVTDMGSMFGDCSGLTSLDVSGFDTSNVTDMGGIFSGCSGLTSLDLSGFDTSNVTYMNNMFSNCSGLTSLDVSGFDTSNVTGMSYMFSNCSGLTSLDLSGFNTPNVMTMGWMFYGCSGLMSLDVSNFNTDNVTDMSCMFYYCSGLTSLDVSDFNTDNVTDMDGMFFGCSGLTSLNVSGFNTSNVTEMDHMFASCSGLTSLDVSSFNTSSVTGMGSMFRGCRGLTSLDVSGFDTSNVTNMGGMFYGCSGLTRIYADEGKWSTANVTNSNTMFFGCTSLIGGNGKVYDANHTNAEYARIDKEGQPGYFTEKEPEPYAVLSDDNTVLTFYYDDQKTSRNGMGVGPFDYVEIDTDVWGVNSGWYGNREQITTVVFDNSFADYSDLTSTAYWFFGCNSLSTITGIENLNTSNVESMTAMFYECSSLTTIDVSGFDTKNVFDMRWLFYGCSGLTTLDVSGFNTDNVLSMKSMFYDCSGLTTLDVSKFNTANVTDMSYMFYGCSSLTSLDVSKFNTSNVIYMAAMFNECSSLSTLDVSGFDTKNVIDMRWLFYDCSGLTILDVSKFNTANVTNMYAMFCGCSSLTSLDVSGFNTAKVTNMLGMFYECTALTTLDLSKFNTANVTDMSYMFTNCSNLTFIYANETNWSTVSITDSESMFYGCTSLVGGNGTEYDENHIDAEYARIDKEGQPGYFTQKDIDGPVPYAVLSDDNTVLTFYYDDQKTSRGGIDINNSYIVWGYSSPYGTATTAVFDASFADYRPVSTAYWFMRCSSLTTITGIENLNTSNVKDMRYMFSGCSGLTSLDVSGFNTSNVTNMTATFSDCSGLTSLNMSGFNTSKVTNMSTMFWGCPNLTTLDVSNFNTAVVTDMSYMFYGCSGLTSLDLIDFNTENVTDMTKMFYNCSNLKTIYCKDTWTCDTSDGMFYGCTSLVGAISYDSNKTDVTYANPDTGYFTSLKEGYFVAGSNPSTGLEYDFDNAVEIAEGVDSYGYPCLVATVGEKNAYVSQVMISTFFGNDEVFKNHTLKPVGTIVNDPDNWLDLIPSSNAKVNLPREGIWEIYIDTEYMAIAFIMIEGKETVTLGDANGDGKVTITDAVAIVNYILGNPSGNFNKEAANVNGDQDKDGNPNITITDAVGVVNIILNSGGEATAPPMEAPAVEAPEVGEPE